jgi:hypothetical protein
MSNYQARRTELTCTGLGEAGNQVDTDQPS